MFLTGFLIGVGLGLFAAALVISVYKLTTAIIRERVRRELPKTAYVKIEKTVQSSSKTTLPTYHAKAYDRNGNKISDIDFEYEESEYFYDGEKITI